MEIYSLNIIRHIEILLQLLENPTQAKFYDYLTIVLQENLKPYEETYLNQVRQHFHKAEFVSIKDILALLKETNAKLMFDRPCKKNWLDLTPTNDHNNIRFCTTCQRNVFKVSNRVEYLKRKQLNQCVAVAFSMNEKYNGGTSCEVGNDYFFEFMGSPSTINNE